MKRLSLKPILLLLALTASLFFAGPVGCNATLDKTGVYQGDKFLYGAERTITTAYKTFDSFLKWELEFRAVLPVEVSRAADTIRVNAKRWIDSASAFRDAYVDNPTPENRDKLAIALNLIDTALAETAKYLTAHKSLANR